MLTTLLKKLFKYKEIGWKEHGEIFYRFTILRCSRFSIYLHKLWAPSFIPTSHDHPWNFLAFVLWGGYWEKVNCDTVFWRGPGSVMYRPAEFVHNVKTCGWNWSLVICSPKRRSWDFNHCEESHESN